MRAEALQPRLRRPRRGYYAGVLRYVLARLGKGPEEATPEEVFKVAFFSLNYDWRVAREAAKVLITMKTNRRPRRVDVLRKDRRWVVKPRW